MKTVDPATQALIESGDFFSADLYSITTFTGEVLRYTTANFSISDGTNLWSSDGVRIRAEGTTGQARWKVGLDTDTWTVCLFARDAVDGTFVDMIGDIPFLEAVQAGALDQADVEISRAYFAGPPTPGPDIPPTGALLVGEPLLIFAGQVSEVDTSHMVANVTIRDYRYLLNQMTPPHVYQAGCRHTLFDQGCALTAGNFDTTGTVGLPLSRNTIKPNPGLIPPAGSGTYRLGRIVMTSGENDGNFATISDWDGDTLTLVTPLPYTPQVGDTFVVYPGCDKTMATCTAFANLANFGGTPFVPAAEVAV